MSQPDFVDKLKIVLLIRETNRILNKSVSVDDITSNFPNLSIEMSIEEYKKIKNYSDFNKIDGVHHQFSIEKMKNALKKDENSFNNSNTSVNISDFIILNLFLFEEAYEYLSHKNIYKSILYPDFIFDLSCEFVEDILLNKNHSQTEEKNIFLYETYLLDRLKFFSYNKSLLYFYLKLLFIKKDFFLFSNTIKILFSIKDQSLNAQNEESLLDQSDRLGTLNETNKNKVGSVFLKSFSFFNENKGSSNMKQTEAEEEIEKKQEKSSEDTKSILNEIPFDEYELVFNSTYLSVSSLMYMTMLINEGFLNEALEIGMINIERIKYSSRLSMVYNERNAGLLRRSFYLLSVCYYKLSSLSLLEDEKRSFLNLSHKSIENSLSKITLSYINNKINDNIDEKDYEEISKDLGSIYIFMYIKILYEDNNLTEIVNIINLIEKWDNSLFKLCLTYDIYQLFVYKVLSYIRQQDYIKAMKEINQAKKYKSKSKNESFLQKKGEFSLALLENYVKVTSEYSFLLEEKEEGQMKNDDLLVKGVVSLIENVLNEVENEIISISERVKAFDEGKERERNNEQYELLTSLIDFDHIKDFDELYNQMQSSNKTYQRNSSLSYLIKLKSLKIELIKSFILINFSELTFYTDDQKYSKLSIHVMDMLINSFNSTLFSEPTTQKTKANVLIIKSFINEYLKKDLPSIETFLKKVIDINPSSPYYIKRLVLNYLKQENFSLAYSHLSNGIRMNCKEIGFFYLFSEYYKDNNDENKEYECLMKELENQKYNYNSVLYEILLDEFEF